MTETIKAPDVAPDPERNGPARSAPPHAQTVKEWVERLARWLPEQRPLGIFVHSNPMEALESKNFHAACEGATRIRRAHTTLSLSRYKGLLADHQIRAEDVASELKRLQLRELEKIDELPTPRPGTLLLSTVRPEMALEVSDLVDAFLLRILPAFLDLAREQARAIEYPPLGVPTERAHRTRHERRVGR